MPIRHWLALTVCVVSANCAAPGSVVWSRDNTTSEQFALDRNTCIFEAKRATASYGPGPRPYSMGDAIGLGLVHGMEINARQQEVYGYCMLSKGYNPAGREPQSRLINPVAKPRAPVPAIPVAERPPMPVISATQGVYHAQAVEAAMRAGCEPISDVRPGVQTHQFETYIMPCASGTRMPLFCDRASCRVISN